jgi:hypothetical protein
MKTFSQFLKEAATPGKKIVSASGINGSGKTTVKYEDGTTAVLTGSRPIRNNNPGNLEYGPFAQSQGAVGSDGRYAVFPTKDTGWQAKINLLKTNTYQSLSIKDAFNRYAPPSENPNYIRDLQQRTGFDLNRQMSSLNEEEFKKLVDAVAVIEGAGEYVGRFPTVAAGSVPDYTSTENSSTENATPAEKEKEMEPSTLRGVLSQFAKGALTLFGGS